MSHLEQSQQTHPHCLYRNLKPLGDGDDGTAGTLQECVEGPDVAMCSPSPSVSGLLALEVPPGIGERSVVAVAALAAAKPEPLLPLWLWHWGMQ